MGIGRGNSLMVIRAFSNQCAAKLKCACKRLAFSHLVSTTRPRAAHADSTHCRTTVPLRRLYRENSRYQIATITVAVPTASIAIRSTTSPQMRMLRLAEVSGQDLLRKFLKNFQGDASACPA